MIELYILSIAFLAKVDLLIASPARAELSIALIATVGL